MGRGFAERIFWRACHVVEFEPDEAHANKNVSAVVDVIIVWCLLLCSLWIVQYIYHLKLEARKDLLGCCST